MLLAGVRGAPGLALRRALHPFLLGRRTTNLVLGRDVIFRGIDRISLGHDAKIDDNCLFDSFPEARGITIGQSCSFERNVILSTGPLSSGEVTFGDEVSVGAGSQLFGHGGLTIGGKVMIGGMTYIVAGTHNFTDAGMPMRDQGHSGKGIIVEDDVWIGAGCIVLDGVRIGRGAIVGAGAVVNRDVPERGVVAGVPAGLLRQR